MKIEIWTLWSITYNLQYFSFSLNGTDVTYFIKQLNCRNVISYNYKQNLGKLSNQFRIFSLVNQDRWLSKWLLYLTNIHHSTSVCMESYINLHLLFSFFMFCFCLGFLLWSLVSDLTCVFFFDQGMCVLI